MTKFPIVIEGDWLQLIYEEAETDEQALINAVSRYIEMVDEIDLKIDPNGVEGHFTPTKSLKIFYSDETVESTWTIPDQH